MGDDIQKGTTYATGGVGGQGSITSANLNAHVDDAIIKATFISTKAARTTATFTDNTLVEAGGTLYKVPLSTLYEALIQPGGIIQTVAATPYTATDALAVIPADDTIPQITEGTQILTLTITPRSSLSKIRLTFSGFGSINSTAHLSAALFRVGLSDALQTTGATIAGVSYHAVLALDWMDNPGVITAVTYTVRAGPASGTAHMNGGSGIGRYFGGSAACTLVAQEIKQS